MRGDISVGEAPLSRALGDGSPSRLIHGWNQSGLGGRKEGEESGGA